MKFLFCSQTEDVDVLKGMLTEEGIACEVTNYENPLPGAEFYPKLWVDEADFAAASAILSDGVRKITSAHRLVSVVSGGSVCPSCANSVTL